MHCVGPLQHEGMNTSTETRGRKVLTRHPRVRINARGTVGPSLSSAPASCVHSRSSCVSKIRACASSSFARAGTPGPWCYAALGVVVKRPWRPVTVRESNAREVKATRVKEKNLAVPMEGWVVEVRERRRTRWTLLVVPLPAEQVDGRAVGRARAVVGAWCLRTVGHQCTVPTYWEQHSPSIAHLDEPDGGARHGEGIDNTKRTRDAREHTKRPGTPTATYLGLR